MRSHRLFGSCLIVAAFVSSLLNTPVNAQVTSNERDMAFGMLTMTKDAIKNNYYDPTFHGVDLDFVFEQAKERMKAATNRDQLMMTIASAVLSLDDSHTTFFPPARAAAIDYGWQVRVVGDDCYVARVKPKSDAEAKGLKPGDKLITIDGFKPTRKNLWQMQYRYFTIAPTAKVNMTVLSPGGKEPKTLSVETKITKTGNVISIEDYYYRGVVKHGWEDTQKVNEFVEFGNKLVVWKMHTFSIDDKALDNAIAKARSAETLVVDLRDNGGGSVEILKRMIGFFFEKEIKVGDEKKRKETKPVIAKSNNNIFKGKLIVLVGHESASASEVFSKIIQLEKRGTIIGDRTMGAVMESKFEPLDSGFGKNLWFGASVTVADLIMPDGKSLEKIGVTPDMIMLPTSADIAAGSDPVLSQAALMAGVELSPEKAGTFFPYEWPKQ